jgi:hypothetical protein
MQQTATWTASMHEQRIASSAEELKEFARKLHVKNEDTLTRLSTGKRTKEQIESLRVKFQKTADEQVEVERQRLEAEDMKAHVKSTTLMANSGVFQREEENFIETYTHNEKLLVERLLGVAVISDRTLSENIRKADEQFYDVLYKELTKIPEGPSAAPVEGFPMAKYLMLVSIRDKKRHEEITGWFTQRDSEFLQIKRHVDTENSRILTGLSKEFDILIDKIPKGDLPS